MLRLAFLMLLLPMMAVAQPNRSAAELARENITHYLTTKIFKGQTYQSQSFGNLIPYRIPHPELVWMMEHRFEILEKGKDQGPYWHSYYFVFFLDKKMNIQETKSSW